MFTIGIVIMAYLFLMSGMINLTHSEPLAFSRSFSIVAKEDPLPRS